MGKMPPALAKYHAEKRAKSGGKKGRGKSSNFGGKRAPPFKKKGA